MYSSTNNVFLDCFGYWFYTKYAVSKLKVYFIILLGLSKQTQIAHMKSMLMSYVPGTRC